MGSTVKEPSAAESKRIRTLTAKGMDVYNNRRDQLHTAQENCWKLVADAIDNNDGDVKELFSNYVKAADIFLEFLLDTFTEESLNLRSQCIDKCDVRKRYYTDYAKQQLLEQTITEQKSVVSSTKTKSSKHSSKIDNALAFKYAQAEAARTRLLFAQKEATLKRQQAELDLRKTLIDSDRDILAAEEEAAVAVAEAEALERFSERGSDGSQASLPVLPKEESNKSVQNYINKIPEQYPEIIKESEKHQNPNPAFLDFSQFLVKKDLLISRLSKFDDKPENFVSWKGSFKNIMVELNSTSAEELDLLTKYLGPSSSKQATSLRSAYGSSSGKAVAVIWERLEERYGAPELVAEALKKKLQDLPYVTAKDPKMLYTLADVLTEIECVQQDDKIKPLLAVYDSSAGVSPIIAKLPHAMQEKWVTRASSYKAKNGVVYPPFSLFVAFVKEMAKIRNDPSFQFHSATPTNTKTTPTVNRQGFRQPPQSTGIFTRKTEIETENKPKCPIHKLNHSLNDCRTFKGKTLEERRNFLRENNFCYKCCLSDKHRARECKTDRKCSDCGSAKHATAMHVSNSSTSANARNTETQGGEQVNQTGAVYCTEITSPDHGKSCAKLVLANVYHADCPENVVKCYVMLDEQSNKSLVKPEMFSRLGIQSKEYQYTINSCTGSVVTDARIADRCIVESLDGAVHYELPQLIECTQIPNNRDEICSPNSARHFPHLEQVANSMHEIDSDAEILLLLGRDALEAHHVHDQVVGPPGTPFAQRIGLGWVVVGEICMGGMHVGQPANVYKTHVLDSGRPSLFEPCLNKVTVEALEPIFYRDADDDKPSLSIDDRDFLKIMDNSFHKDETSRWVAPLPFREPRERLPSNKDQALKRAKILDSSLRKNPVKARHFTEFMDKIFKNDHAEIAPKLKPDEECWYLPIFGVYHPQKPNQIRGVFDSSATCEGLSLNSVLLSGPDLTNKLIGVLMRFRREVVAVVADIEQMFYCFSVSEEHRNFLRFFWYEGNDLSKPLVEYRMRKHVFGNSPSPAVATYGLRKSVEGCEKDVQEFVQKDFYVDDGLTSRCSAAEAVDLLQRSQASLAKCGLRLHKIASNDPEVLKCFPADDLNKDLKSVDFDASDLPLQRSLGVGWDLSRDSFVFKIDLSDRPLSKRGVLSTVNSVFDPLGFVAPVVILGRLIMRDVVSVCSGWDDSLPAELEAKWVKWRDDLSNLSVVQIPRSYFGKSPSSMDRVELHVFSDASESAIAAVAYVVGFPICGERSVGFVSGKAKVAPSSGHTIPRLELCAAVLATELYKSILDNIDMAFSGVRFFTDSRIVLGYINNQTRRFFTYVSNRVQKIRSCCSPSQWSYIASESNPADVGSRGIDPVHLTDSLWLTGPPSLYRDPEPIPEFFPLLDADDDTEVRRQVTVSATSVDSKGTPSLSDRFKKFSTWDSLVSAISVLKHKAVSLGKASTSKGSNQGGHSVDFRKKTETFIIQKVQEEFYADEILGLKQEQRVKKGSHIASLNPFLDQDGLLGVGGRLSRSSLSQSEKHPLILPGKHHVTKLLVQHFHSLVQHQGRHYTEGAVRAAGFWVTGGKRLVSSVLHHCVKCKKLRGQFACQRMSDLPLDRVEEATPFTYTGVDVFGPWHVTSRRTRGGQASSKRWAVIFSCQTIRAVHIEVLEDISSSSFINALRRFVAVRGRVKQFRSDRGTNFVGATDSIQVEAINVEDAPTQAYLRKAESVWLFNPPHSSHMGGSWERMIGLARRIFESMLADVKNLTHDVLTTLMAEVAAIMNARPIVSVSNDPENPAVLSPSALLTQKLQCDQQPLGDLNIKELYKDQWRRVQLLADQFWLRWRQEYLQSLQSRRKWTDEQDSVQVDDVVLVRDREVCRNSWPMGRVTRVFPSEDGRVRKVEVGLIRNGKLTCYVRPVVELVPLVKTQ